MKRARVASRRTDYGTFVLHWVLVAALLVAIATGLRIATESPDRSWLNALDLVLPKEAVWTTHIPAALVLVGVSLAYAVYVRMSGLSRRIRLDHVRISGLFGGRDARWSAVNLALYWIFYLAFLAQLVTGGALYFGFADRIMVKIHWFGTWVIVFYAPAHLLAQAKLGGLAQVFRIFRPAAAPPRPMDSMELVALLSERLEPPARQQQDDRLHRVGNRPRVQAEREPTPGAASLASGRTDGRHRRSEGDSPRAPRHRSTLQANPFAVALAVAVVGASFLITVGPQVGDTLVVHRISNGDAPLLDGDSSDPVWRLARPISVLTEHGGNFDGTGETTVHISAVHDGTWAYFLFIWEDPTRSLKQLPLRKAPDGWHLLHDGYEIGDEHAYNEDKFSVLLTKSAASLAGDHTFHAGPKPLADAPRTLTGRGLHYSSEIADVWQWKATSSAQSGFLDDDYFGRSTKPTPAQLSGIVPYRGGFAPDPGSVNYENNFMPGPTGDFSSPITPRRLPKDYRVTMAALGQIDLDCDHGDAEHARWFMTESESVPYAPEADSRIPVGTIIPGVVIVGSFAGDRADVRGTARWAAGRWALETARRLDTGSPYDVAISTGTFLRVAAFDHSQIRHTRHVRPIRLEVE